MKYRLLSNEKLIIITTYTTAGIIMCQGNTFETFQDTFFLQLKTLVDQHEKHDRTSLKVHERNTPMILESETTPKTAYEETQTDTPTKFGLEEVERNIHSS